MTHVLSRTLAVIAAVCLCGVAIAAPVPLYSPPTAVPSSIVTYGSQPNQAASGNPGVGTSGNNVCPLSGNCTHSGTDNFTGPFQKNGVAQTFPSSGALVGATDTQVLQNKTINGTQNTLLNIPSTALPIGAASGTVAAGNDSRIVNAVQPVNGLIDGTLLPNGQSLLVNPTGDVAALCGHVYSSVAASSDITVFLPTAPLPNCSITLVAQQYSIWIDPQGVFLRNMIARNVRTRVKLPAPGEPLVGANLLTIIFDGNAWNVSGGTPDGVVSSDFGPGQLPSQGQVRLSYDSVGTRLQLCRFNGSGGLVVGGVLRRIASTCLMLPVSAFADITGSFRYIYVNWNLLDVSSITNDGSGHALMTFVSPPVGMQTGTPITCVNLDGTPLANQTNDPNTVVSGNTVTLTDVSFVANNTQGKCNWLGLNQGTNAPTVVNGIPVQTSNNNLTLVGAVYVDGSSNLNDSETNRSVVSYYNRQLKELKVPVTSALATGQGTYHTPNTATVEGTFVILPVYTAATGDQVPALQWWATGSAAGDTLGAVNSTAMQFTNSPKSVNGLCPTPDPEHATLTQAVANYYQNYGMRGTTTTLVTGRNVVDLCMKTSGTTFTLNANEFSIGADLYQ